MTTTFLKTSSDVASDWTYVLDSFVEVSVPRNLRAGESKWSQDDSEWLNAKTACNRVLSSGFAWSAAVLKAVAVLRIGTLEDFAQELEGIASVVAEYESFDEIMRHVAPGDNVSALSALGDAGLTLRPLASRSLFPPGAAGSARLQILDEFSFSEKGEDAILEVDGSDVEDQLPWLDASLKRLNAAIGVIAKQSYLSGDKAAIGPLATLVSSIRQQLGKHLALEPAVLAEVAAAVAIDIPKAEPKPVVETLDSIARSAQIACRQTLVEPYLRALVHLVDAQRVEISSVLRQVRVLPPALSGVSAVLDVCESGLRTAQQTSEAQDLDEERWEGTEPPIDPNAALSQLLERLRSTGENSFVEIFVARAMELCEGDWSMRLNALREDHVRWVEEVEPYVTTASDFWSRLAALEATWRTSDPKSSVHPVLASLLQEIGQTPVQRDDNEKTHGHRPGMYLKQELHRLKDLSVAVLSDAKIIEKLQELNEALPKSANRVSASTVANHETEDQQ